MIIKMAQDLITSLDPYNGVCEKYENGKRRMYVILSPEEVWLSVAYLMNIFTILVVRLLHIIHFCGPS